MQLFAKHPLEALLRRPIEWVSSTLLFALAAAIYLLPSVFYLNRAWSIGLSCVVCLLGVYRGLQGFQLIRYQRNLVNPRSWILNFDNIPESRDCVFLGRGFIWTTKHTQRLKETQSPSATRYLSNSTSTASGESNKLPPSGKLELHGVELHEKRVWMSLADRVGHTLVLGSTRVGKTRLAELLIAQDIQRNDVVIVFDPKGDEELLRRVVAEARRANRLNDLLVFHLGYPEHSCRYNAIGRFDRITEVATRIANQLPSAGNSAAFKEFAWRFVNIIAGALVALKKTPNYRLIRRCINDIEPLFIEYAQSYLHKTASAGWFQEVREHAGRLERGSSLKSLNGRSAEAVALLSYIQKLDQYDPVLDGLVSAYKYDRTYFDKIVSSVGPLMEKLTTGSVADLISPEESDSEDARPRLDWLSAIRDRQIVYVGLDALSDNAVAGAVGNSMFADLVSVAGHIYKHGVGHPDKSRRVAVHADEFNELIGDEFVPLLNKAGGAGFAVTAYTQTWSDIEAQIGSRAKAGQIAGNFNSLIMLRVRELATANMLIDQLPKTTVIGKSTSSGAGDSSKEGSSVDFETSHADSLTKSERPLVGPSDVFALPRGHAFALIDAGRLWKVRFPLPSQKDALMPADLDEVFELLLPPFELEETDYSKIREQTNAEIEESTEEEEIPAE